MKRSIEKFIETHGDKRTQYKILIHGNDSTPQEIRCDKVNELERGTAKFPALHEDLAKIGKKGTKTASQVGVHQVKSISVDFVGLECGQIILISNSKEQNGHRS